MYFFKSYEIINMIINIRRKIYISYFHVDFDFFMAKENFWDVKNDV